MPQKETRLQSPDLFVTDLLECIATPETESEIVSKQTEKALEETKGTESGADSLGNSHQTDCPVTDPEPPSMVTVLFDSMKSSPNGRAFHAKGAKPTEMYLVMM